MSNSMKGLALIVIGVLVNNVRDYPLDVRSLASYIEC